MSDYFCAEREATGDWSDHCLHEWLDANGEYEQVCCFCGDLFLSAKAEHQHGPYEPKPRSRPL